MMEYLLIAMSCIIMKLENRVSPSHVLMRRDSSTLGPPPFMSQLSEDYNHNIHNDILELNQLYIQQWQY